MILPLAGIAAMLQEGVGHLMREAGLVLMMGVMEEEVRHVVGERSVPNAGRRRTGGEKSKATASSTGRRFRSSGRGCAIKPTAK